MYYAPLFPGSSNIPLLLIFLCDRNNKLRYMREFQFRSTANDRFSGNNYYSGIKNPDRFSTIVVVDCTVRTNSPARSYDQLKKKMKTKAIGSFWN